MSKKGTYYGVYDADGGIIGELTYMCEKVFTRKHCFLCDITHGLLTMRGEWKDAVSAFPHDFELLHLNEQPAAMQAFTEGRAPCVLREENGSYHMVLSRDALEEIDTPAELFAALLSAHSGDASDTEPPVPEVGAEATDAATAARTSFTHARSLFS